MATGCRQDVDFYGSEAPVSPTVFELFRKAHDLSPDEAWVVATNKSFSLMGGSKLRDFGDPYAANVVLPKQLLIDTIKEAVGTGAGPVGDRLALAERMMSALDEGYEGFGWRVHESGRALDNDLKATLAKSLLDYFNDPTMPTSGDELTYFMSKEIMTRFAPSLLLVNFWDIDIAHYGAFSLYLDAIRRTDRLVAVLWRHAQSLPEYRDRTTLLVVPELGRTRQSIQDLQPRLFQLVRPLRHTLLERRIVLAQTLVQESRLQQVAHAQPHLGGTQRLRQEVARSGRQGTAPRVRCVIARRDQDRQVGTRRLAAQNPVDEIEPVQPPHPQVHDHDIGIDLLEAIQRFHGVRYRDQLAVPLRLEDMAQKLQVRWLVVHEQNARAR